MTDKELLQAIDYNICITLRGKRLKQVLNWLDVAKISSGGILFDVKDYPINDYCKYIIGGAFGRNFDKNTSILIVNEDNELPY